MGRQSLTPSTRRANVTTAAQDLPAAIDRAVIAGESFGYDDPRSLKAWEIVETLGATVHRQSRILAGKSRGG